MSLRPLISLRFVQILAHRAQNSPFAPLRSPPKPGIRYLENAFKNLDMEQYDLVKEALAERGHMLKAAPYMNSPLPIMIPMYCHNWYDPILIPYYLIGAKVYDFVGRLQGDSGVPHSHFIDVEEAKFQFPMINEKNLWGAIVYYDGQMNDSRMNLHLALTATQAGAAVASRMEVTKINKDKEGKVRRTLCPD